MPATAADLGILAWGRSSKTTAFCTWIGSLGGMSVAHSCSMAGLPAGGVIRPCRKGRKIGPLVATTAPPPRWCCRPCWPSVGGGEIFLDVPSINRDAVDLAQDLGLASEFETARMYTGRSSGCGWISPDFGCEGRRGRTAVSQLSIRRPGPFLRPKSVRPTPSAYDGVPGEGSIPVPLPPPPLFADCFSARGFPAI